MRNVFQLSLRKQAKLRVVNSNHVGRGVTYTAQTYSCCLKLFLRRSSSATSNFFKKEYSKVKNPQCEVWQILTRNCDEIVIFEYDFFKKCVRSWRGTFQKHFQTTGACSGGVSYSPTKVVWIHDFGFCLFSKWKLKNASHTVFGM